MLTQLRIRNLALVDELVWNPGAGFVAVTGETGAGKSIIIGALQLLLGGRADRSLIRGGEKACAIEAVLRPPDPPAMDAWLDAHGLDPCSDGELILKRSIETTGTNRQFINGGPTTLAVLRSMGELLVDLHGPHDHQSLFSTARQLEALDSYADTLADARTFRDLHERARRLRADRDTLARGEADLGREADLLRHQVLEIDAAALRPEDGDGLEDQYRQAVNARRLIELSSRAAGILDGEEDSVRERMSGARRLLGELADLDASMAALNERFESLIIEVGQAAADLTAYAESLDVDPERAAILEERMNTVQSLKRKYGPTIEDILAFAARARERLSRIDDRGGELDRLDAELDRLHADMRSLGERLTRARRKAATTLAKSVRGHLARLGFPRAGFEIALTARDEPAADGYDQVEFQFAPNVGEAAQPLRAIASSGEISRVMLALKSSIAGRSGVPVMVFDEIDANIGGEVAHAVGAMMATLGRDRQILCITHLPQVAAAADHHFRVSKAVRDGRTLSELAPVADTDREREIVRMLGGGGAPVLAHAREMLAGRGDSDTA